MFPLAHIGNIPVEEYGAFVIPVVLLVVYGRAWSRRHRRALARLPDPAEPLPERTVERVLARWRAAGHQHLAPDQLPLLYPPGPDGATARELADRLHTDAASMRRRMEELADLGYLELDGDPDSDDLRSWLTVEGITLQNMTEQELLAAHNESAPSRPVPGGLSGGHDTSADPGGASRA